MAPNLFQYDNKRFQQTICIEMGLPKSVVMLELETYRKKCSESKTIWGFGRDALQGGESKVSWQCDFLWTIIIKTTFAKALVQD